MANEIPELKSCPFCGCEMIHNVFDGPRKQGWDSGSHTHPHSACVMKDIFLAPHLYDAWNTRHAPTVKPLVWVEGRGPRFEETECGSYELYYTGDNGRTLLSFGAGNKTAKHQQQFSGDVLGRKAMAKAQEDHERRILSAIER